MNNEISYNKEKTTFIKYGLAAMINEYNSLDTYSKKKEYIDAIASWYNHEKTTLAKLEDDVRKTNMFNHDKNISSIL